MDDCYNASDFTNDQLLDELMCEYVDGTMDPCVRSAFDELLSSSPEIARQIEGLAEAQHFLKQTGCSLCAPRQFQSKLRARLDAETGKIHVYGLPATSTNRMGYAQYAILAVVLLVTSVALSRHDNVQTPFSSLTSSLSSPSQVAAPAKMTPASRPQNVDVGLLVSSTVSLDMSVTSRKSKRIPTAEAELTFLGD